MPRPQQDAWGVTAPPELGSPKGSPFLLKPLPLRLAIGAVVLLVLGLGTIVIAGWLLLEEHETTPIIIGAFGAFLTVMALALFARRARMRCSLTLHDHGILLERKGKVTAILYVDLEVLSFTKKEILNNGIPNGILATLRLKSRRKTTVLTDYVDLTQEQVPFGGYIDGIIEDRAKSVRQTFEGSGMLRGEGWRLDNEGLRIGGATTPLSSIVMTRVSGGKARLWRSGEQEPFLIVSEGSPNIYVLLAMILPHLPEEPPALSEDLLGRLMFTRQLGRTGTIILLLLDLFLFAGGVIAILSNHNTNETLPLGIILLGIGVLVLLGVVYRARFRLDVYTRGMRRRGLFSTRQVLYNDLTSLTHMTTRHYVNGAYTGTTHVLRFIPDAGAGKPIGFSTQSQGSDEEIENFRDGVAEIIAVKMADEVRRDGSIPWTPSTQLTQEGVRYKTQKIFGKGEELVLPFDEELLFEFADGFLLLKNSDEQPECKIPIGAPNFYPGFVVMQWLAGGEEAQA